MQPSQHTDHPRRYRLPSMTHRPTGRQGFDLCYVILTGRNNGNTLCLKKVPTFKLSVTLSILNQFSKFCTAGKRMKFATKPVQQSPPHFKHVATLPWDIKNSNFLQIFSRYGKMQRNCIFSAPILIPLRALLYTLSVFRCFYHNLVLVAECRVDCWQTLQCHLLWRISRATDLSQSKQVKEHSDTENFICNQYGEKLAILDN